MVMPSVEDMSYMWFATFQSPQTMLSSDRPGHVWVVLMPASALLISPGSWDKKAREIWFLCRQYNAQEALGMGLVNKVVPFDRLEDEVVEWAETMMQHSPLALRMIKAGLNAELDGQAGIQELAGDATMLYYLTEEAQEGKQAFLEKRKPNFKKFPKLP